MAVYDVIVLGAGGVGSAAMWQLANRGVRVLGLDRFAPPHDRGSSHGQTRAIRQAYFEHPDYTPLLLESYQLWSELEERSGKQLYHEVGVVEIGPSDGVVVPGVLRAAEEHRLPVESLSAAEASARWPGLEVGGDLVAAFEPRAGYLMVEDCVGAQLELAQRAGAELRTSVEVSQWDIGDTVRLETSEGRFEAARLIVTAGAWAGALLGDLALPLAVRRKSLLWYAADGPEYTREAGFPVFLFELANGVFYGFPQIDQRGVKVAEHSGGKQVDDPLAVDRQLHEDEGQRIEAFLQEHLPQVSMRRTDHAVCMYTMTPDEHFVVDRHPVHTNIAFAAGLSGHGFKMAPALGKAVADLVLEGTTALPIDFLSAGRFLKKL